MLGSEAVGRAKDFDTTPLHQCRGEVRRHFRATLPEAAAVEMHDNRVGRPLKPRRGAWAQEALDLAQSQYLNFM